MSQRTITILAASALTAVLCLGSVQSARADGAASTRNIILGAAAIAAGIIIGQNVAHKRELANTVAGYTSDGATVYADGRVVYSNGASYYPGDRGQQIACRNMQCSIGGDATANNGYWQWNGSAWVSAQAGNGYPPNLPNYQQYPPNYQYQPGYQAQSPAYQYPPGYQYPPAYEYPQPTAGYPAYGDNGAGAGAGAYNRYSAYAAAYNAYYEAYKVYYKAYYEHYNSLRYRSSYRSGEQVSYPQPAPMYRYAPPSGSGSNGDYCCAPETNPYTR
jgi:hypothetical protein